MHRHHLQYLVNGAAAAIPIAQKDQFNAAVDALLKLVEKHEAETAIKADLEKATAKHEAVA